VVGLAAAAARTGALTTALRWLAAVTCQAQAIGYHIDPLYRALAEETGTQARTRLGAAASSQAAGQALSWEATTAEALASAAPTPCRHSRRDDAPGISRRNLPPPPCIIIDMDPNFPLDTRN
jgi:hypothetical protein